MSGTTDKQYFDLERICDQIKKVEKKRKSKFYQALQILVLCTELDATKDRLKKERDELIGIIQEG